MLFSLSCLAHPGGTDANGGHIDHETNVACKTLLMERFGDAEVYGLFIVRRVPLDSSEDIGDLDIDLT